MTYVKTNWKTGDTITADKLNNIENGIASSGGGGGTDRFFEVHFDVETLTLDKTWQQIFDAIEDGKIPFYIMSDDTQDFAYASFYQGDIALQSENTFNVYFHSITFADGGGFIQMMPFSTNSASGYPVIED